jgi:RHS repeat-associated protein
VEAGVVKYSKNGAVFYTSGVAPQYPLLADTSLYQTGAAVTNVVISGESGGGAAAAVRWLVADQLGTPRMVLDRTGSLAGVTRHDYLPFGEEIFAGTGGRTTSQGYGEGYGAADGVRQQFTGYERDDETKLDFAQARYYANSQGRFTSTDPLQASARPGAPQTWNRYAYVGNNPLSHTDPTGMSENGVDDPSVQGTPANRQQQQRRQQPTPAPTLSPPRRKTRYRPT